MPTLKSKSVQIFDTPRSPTNKTCDSQWSKKGTCCDLNSLIAYSKQDGASISSGLKLALNSLFNISVHISQTVLMGDFLTKHQVGWIGLIATYSKVFSRQDMGHFRELISSVPKNFKAHQQAGQKCWATVSNIRALSLCSTCAGDSEKYFNAHAALIRSNTCSDIMSSCEHHFLTLIRFVLRSTEFFSEVYQVGVQEKQIQVEQNRDIVEEIRTNFEALKKLHLLKLLNTYIQSAPKSAEKSAALINICEVTTDLGQAAFIVKVLPILQKIELLSKNIRTFVVRWTRNNVKRVASEKGQSVQAVDAELTALVGEPKPPARVLQSAPRLLKEIYSVEKTFQGDVKVIDSGTFTSSQSVSSNFPFKSGEAMELPGGARFP